jgi:hypothetical protein
MIETANLVVNLVGNSRVTKTPDRFFAQYVFHLPTIFSICVRLRKVYRRN